MVKEDLISVIVPVYNAERYLQRCINSIVNQTYHNLEIILVNDGSTDKSGEICDSYKDDMRIKVIHQKNLGPSSARNHGLNVATGDYIGFVDSDDYISLSMYEDLYKCMKPDIDITCCGTECIYKHENIVIAKTKEESLFSTEQALFELLRGEFLTFSQCDKLFRRELIGKTRFLRGRLCEDLPFTYQLIKESKGVINIGEIKYYYSCYGKRSRSRSPFTFRRIDYVLFMRDICKDISKNFPQLSQVAEYRYIMHVCAIISEIKNLKNIDNLIILRRLKKVLKRMIFRIAKNPFIDKEQKKCVLKNIME